MQLSKDTNLKIKYAACREFPKEMCGVIIDGEFKQLENIHKEPEDNFSMDNPYEADAIVHSHTLNKVMGNVFDARSPSELDQEQYFASAIPWGITATDGKAAMDLMWKDDNDRPPLLGRQFVYGAQDCWSLIRDFYHLEGIELIDTVRADDWESNPQKDYYGELWQSEGFYRVSSEELRRGDMIYFNISGPRYNHAAVYLGEDRILHHLLRKLSSEDTLSRWMNSASLFLRHKDYK